MDEIIFNSDEEDNSIMDQQRTQTDTEDVLQFAFKHLYQDEPTDESSDSGGECCYKIEKPDEETLQPIQRMFRSRGVDDTSDDEIFTVFEVSVKDIPPRTRPTLDFTPDSSPEPTENDLKSHLNANTNTTMEITPENYPWISPTLDFSLNSSTSHKETGATPRKGKTTERKQTILFPHTSKQTSPPPKICQMNEELTKTGTLLTETLPKPEPKRYPYMDEESCPILDKLFFSDEPKKKLKKHGNEPLHILKQPLKVSDDSSIIIDGLPEDLQSITPKGLQIIVNKSPENSKTELNSQPKQTRAFHSTTKAIDSEPAATSTPLCVPQTTTQSLQILDECSVFFEETDASLFNTTSSRLNDLCKASKNESTKYIFTTKPAQSSELKIKMLGNDYAAFASKTFDKVFPTKIENVLNAKKLRSGMFQHNDVYFNTVKLVGYVRSLDRKQGVCNFLLYDDTGRIEIRYQCNQERLNVKNNADIFEVNKDILKRFRGECETDEPFTSVKKKEGILQMASFVLRKKYSLRNQQFPMHTEINWGMKLTVIGRVCRFDGNYDGDATTVLYPWCIKLQNNESESVLQHLKMMNQQIRRMQ